MDVLNLVLVRTMLDIMERFTVEDVKKALFSCYDIGLYSLLGFMVGMPGKFRNCKSIWSLGEIAARLRVPMVQTIWLYRFFYAIPLVGTSMIMEKNLDNW